LAEESVLVRIRTPDRELEAEVPYREGMTLLDALLWIKEHEAPDLEFQYSCRNAQCGTCAVLINGRAGLACEYRLEPGEEVTVEPLRHLPVLRDLVVDWREVTERLRPLSPRSNLDWFRRLDREESERLHELRSCIECLCCVAECPVIRAGSTRNPGPTVLRKAAEEAEKWDRVPELEDVYACTTCHRCAEVCPRDIDIPKKAVETLRARLRERGLGPLKEHREVGRRAVRTGRSVEKKEASFLEEHAGEYGSGDVKALFFTGCLVDYRLPETGRALISLAEELGFRLVVPEDQVCCGSPLLRTGQRDRADRLAFRNLEAFQRVDPDVIVTVCAGCGATLKNDYPELLGERFEWEVMDVTEFLVREVRAHERGFKHSEEVVVTYHDPCHLRRGQGVHREPRRLLKAVDGIEFREMREPDRCCGAGGGVRAGLPELARLMADVKARMVEEVGADLLTTVCPFCEYNLREGLERCEVDAEVLNLTVLLARSL